MSEITIPCPQCGSQLEFDPEQHVKLCMHCGYEEEIEEQDTSVEEEDFGEYLLRLKDDAECIEVLTVDCESCGASTQLEANTTSGVCPFCGTNIIAKDHSERLIKPKSLLPFKVSREEAQSLFESWIKSLWFAPSKLSELARSKSSSLSGLYLPHWTYDSYVETDYRGERGEYYYVTESYTDSQGKRRTRRKRKTRWYPASGTVHNRFNDLLVTGGSSLPEAYIEELQPWDLDELTPYTEDYISGFKTESYRKGLEEGFNEAKQMMDPTIRSSICRDIGGDTQRINSMRSIYREISFKHILLPVWLNSYMYDNLIYRFVVNARTGEVQGERPRSIVKILAAVLGVIIPAALTAVISISLTESPVIAIIAAVIAVGLLIFIGIKVLL